MVSTNYFTTPGGEMQLGHGFTGDEDKSADAAAVLVLSHSFWTIDRFQPSIRIVEEVRRKLTVGFLP